MGGAAAGGGGLAGSHVAAAALDAQAPDSQEMEKVPLPAKRRRGRQSGSGRRVSVGQLGRRRCWRRKPGVWKTGGGGQAHQNGGQVQAGQELEKHQINGAGAAGGLGLGGGSSTDRWWWS